MLKVSPRFRQLEAIQIIAEFRFPVAWLCLGIAAPIPASRRPEFWKKGITSGFRRIDAAVKIPESRVLSYSCLVKRLLCRSGGRLSVGGDRCPHLEVFPSQERESEGDLEVEVFPSLRRERRRERESASVCQRVRTLV